MGCAPIKQAAKRLIKRLPPAAGSVRLRSAHLRCASLRRTQQDQLDILTDTERQLRGVIVSFPSHAVYEQTVWESSESERMKIEMSVLKRGHLRVLFDGGMIRETGYGYGSFKVGDNNPIRVEHNYPVASSSLSEWVTLLQALRYLRANIRPRDFVLNVSGDSQNVIYAITGKYTPNTADTVDAYALVRRYLNEYKRANAYWIPRTLVVRHLGH